MKKRIVAIIPARGGSKGVPGKNIIDIGGMPLIAYSIECAKQIKRIDDIVVSTDDEKIAAIARRYGARVPVLRPKELAGDHAKTVDAVEHLIAFLEKYGEYYDVVVLLQPTQPFRTIKDIEDSLDLFEAHDGKGVLTVSKVHEHPILMRYMNGENELKRLLPVGSTVRRQDMDLVFRVNGAVYVNAREDYRLHVSLNDNPLGVVSSQGSEIDIDTWADVERARMFVELKR